MKYLTKYIMSLLLTLVCVSCQDDMFSEMESTVASKPGQYNLSLEMMFAPEEEVDLNSRSAGDRISDISNLYIALFDQKGDYVDNWYFSKDKGNWDKVFISSNIAGTDTDPDKICKVTTNISIPYNGSEMYLVAVANMGDVYNDYSTLTQFRALKFNWDKSWKTGNSQMSGYFTTTKEEAPLGTEQLRDNGLPTIILNGGTTTLHAWLRRAASKVTVDFDTSGLRENIWIYIKDVRVRDIPKSCTAFNINTPKAKDDILTGENDGEIIDYSGGKTDWRLWPALSKSKTSIEKEDFDVHGPKSERSLFFYENMQGEGKDKAQIVAGDTGSTPSFPDGGTPGNSAYKDGKEFGTYVEVNAYYYSTADNNVNSGNITYRFMLGKDTYKNYDVERNHHYKLTLAFNGNANDADWHIDYKYAEKLYIPETYYISSLYGQRMHLPITIGNLDNIMPSLGKDGYVEVTAEILESHWYPDAPAKKGSVSGKTDVEDYFDENLVHDDHKGPQTGFLTLQASEYSRMNKTNYVGRGKSGDKTYLKNYWYGNTAENTDSLGKRKFKLEYATKTLFGDEEGDLYQTTIDESKRNMVFYMPMYTRALFLVKEWSYTGNNPYEEFTRSAQVKIKVKVYNKKGSKYNELRADSNIVEIRQVPRIFNPKGVYRKNGNNNPFEVTLMQSVVGSNGKQYESFLSKGPWSAQIESASLNSKISINEQKAVFGSTDSPINFTINFSSSSSSTENQYAIILVRYHNYTCNHRIIVRQGYNPDIVSKDSDTKWHCFNLRTGAMEAESPVEFGSLFKYGNLTQAIADDNLTEKYFNTKAGTRSLVVLDKDGKRSKTTWDKIFPEPFTSSDGGNFPNTTKGKITLNNGKTARIANSNDFEALRDNADTEYGYGICYGDESLTTLSVGVAGGSYYYNNKSATHSKGMLGCFIYSKDNSHNIFLPSGPTGYGGMDRFGAIRYANAESSLGSPEYRPLLWRLFQNYGVNYWLGDRKKATDPWSGASNYATAWDINISSFDFNTYFMNAHNTHTNAYDASKAFPIRLVEVN